MAEVQNIHTSDKLATVTVSALRWVDMAPNPDCRKSELGYACNNRVAQVVYEADGTMSVIVA